MIDPPSPPVPATRRRYAERGSCSSLARTARSWFGRPAYVGSDCARPGGEPEPARLYFGVNTVAEGFALDEVAGLATVLLDFTVAPCVGRSVSDPA
jgi:hypothetical protein